MYRHLLLVLLTLITLPSFAAKRVTVDQLEGILVAIKGKPDPTMARQLSNLELTERLSAAKLSRLQAASPGPASRLSLLVLADLSGFLDAPAADVPAVPTPDLLAQQKIISLAADYARQTISRLPDFFATGDTLRFQDTPGDLQATPIILPAPLHPVSRTNEKIVYREGREVVEPSSVAQQRSAAEARGVNTAGVFGPILGTVLVDAAHGKLMWSHWEQGPSGREAIFSYIVPKSESHYTVSLSGVFSETSGYHGVIAIDPANGTIHRLVLQADLKSGSLVASSAVYVEYGEVVIGGKTYICPVKSVSVWRAPKLAGAPRFHYGSVVENNQNGNNQLQTFLDDVAFEDYHVFHADARMLAAGSLTPSPEPRTQPADDGRAAEGTASREHAAAEASIADVPSGGSPIGPPTVSSVTPPTTSSEIRVVPSSKPADAPKSAPTAAPAAPRTADSPTPVFRVTPGIVYLDVVVRDRKNNAVNGLTKDDFRIFEEGHAQTIDSFRPVTETASSNVSDSVASPIATNSPAAGVAPETFNVILFDLLDTSPADQSYARTQMLKFLRSLPDGQKIGLFVLTSHELRRVQDFTGSSALLAEAAQRLLSQSSSMFQSKDSQQHSNDVTGSLPGLATPKGADTSVLQDLAQDLASENFEHGQARNEFVIRAFHALAKAMEGLNGRKNLFWLAGDFPLSANSEILAASRIAVYPISVLGMQATSIDAEMNGNGVTASAADSSGGGRLTAQVNQRDADREDLRSRAEQIASQTGGEAFVNVNDIAGALRKSLNSGENYYSLVYSPTDRNWNGKFRKIRVELARRGYSLSYRQGYFAVPASAASPAARPSP